MKRSLIILLLVPLLLTACLGIEQSMPAPTAVTGVDSGAAGKVLEAGQAGEPTAAAAVAGNTPQPADTAAPAEASAAEPSPTTVVAEAVVPAGDDSAASAEDGPGAAEATETAVPQPQAIEVTYFTPAQQEGPYYPLEKPADHDNDLLVVAGASGEPAGERLTFGGVVYDANGQPVPGITVEIWQTDANGIYLHPGDAKTEQRDRNFQFYGESVTAADGVYSFRTIIPGHYEPRPRHIHVKVKRDGQELLTTQFYFANEIDLQGNEAAMLIDPAPAEDDAGNPILVGERDIILSMPLVN